MRARDFLWHAARGKGVCSRDDLMTSLGARLLIAGSISASLPALSNAQALPAATADPISTGFQLPTASGSLQYSVSGIESLTSGYYGGSGLQAATGVAGNLAVITSSKAYPFQLIVSTG